MLKNEWKNLFQNKFLMVVVVAIITIPTIYTTIFLGSMWDPYGEVENLPVAVVNNDVSTEFEGKTVDVGKQLVDNLKENNSLSFNFVNAEQAEAGLQNGTYYMVITIPEDFSQNAITVKDANPRRMEIQYKTNPGTNYIASKMSETAILKIKNTVAEKVTKEYAEVIIDKLDEISDGFDDATDATGTLNDGLKKLQDGSGKIEKNLGKLGDSTLTFKDGVETLDVSLKTYTAGVSSANDGAGKLKDGVDTLASGAGTLTDGASKLSAGASKLDTAAGTYTGGVDQLYKDGTSKLAANNKALNEGVATLGSGLTTLKSGTGSLLSGLNTLSSTLGASLTDEKKAELAKLTAGLPQINDGIQQLNTAVQGIDVSGVGTLVDGVKGGLTSVGTDATKAGTHLAGVKTDLETAVTNIKSNKGFQSLDSADQVAILQAVGAVGADGSNLKSVAADVTSIGTTLKAMNTQLGSADMSALSSVGTLKEKVSLLATNSNVALPGAVTAITSLQTGLENVQTAVDRKGTTPKTMGIVQAMTQINDGAKQLENGVNSKTGLKASLETYTAGVDTVNTNLKKLSSNSGKLKDATGLLATNLSALNDKVPTLANGINQLQSGATQLAAGTAKLTANNGKITEATGKLADGAGKINEATGKLEDATGTLTDKLGTAKDGSKELNEALGEAGDKLKEYDLGNSNAQMIATPVENSGSEMTSVDNNGNAMAAYMMSVGLWVGCLAFSIMYPLSKPSTKVKSGVAWWFSKASIAGPVAVAQAFLMVGVLSKWPGLNPQDMGSTLLIAVLASCAFMSIFYFFNLLIGKVGSFLLLIFMVLQLGGSAGTYPIELSSGFYQAINKFMPFTYSVNAFRSTIANGQSITGAITVFTSIFVVCTALTVVVFHIKGKKINAGEPVVDMDAVIE